MRSGGEANVAQALGEVHAAGFGGYAKMLRAVFQASGMLANKVVNSPITKAEIAVLQALARGQSPKRSLQKRRAVSTQSVLWHNTQPKAWLQRPATDDLSGAAGRIAD